MSFRRLVHLVVNDMGLRCTYSLRSIDMSLLFSRPLDSIGRRPDQPPPMKDQEMKPSPLPSPAVSFYPPRPSWHEEGDMEFMLLGGKHNKVVATDQTGRTVLYDPDQRAVRTLHSFVAPKFMPVSLTTGSDHLYVLDMVPQPGSEDRCFECLEHDPYGVGDEDWLPRVLPPPPYEYEPETWESTHLVDSYAAVGGGFRILVSKAGFGTYSFDTTAAAWSKVGDWTMPFSGGAEYVPEHGLWFGLRGDPCVLCAVNLGAASARMPPVVRDLWTDDLAPLGKWMDPLGSHLVHLGATKFCIARFFTTHLDAPVYPVTQAVFTAVEVERCVNTDGGLRLVEYGSKLYTLLRDMVYWVL